ncbi:glycerate kinase [Roseateles saccharophilus]|uniref:Hydroxypyruvate reductase n=1 Tax=Roseateles saccharophilus TaxID=304 RepID=A0A4R3UGB2_ROSSA|nr:glycerate kinase [Roseateles saccharophilus]MDG0835219.1 glycerate kinase [Roseateles saccharophilus]TCU87151.1 hydroxypyruvate reductase [Roseateles saccharophilus]
MSLDPRALLRQLYDVAVARALPGRVLAAHLPTPPKGRTLVLGAGKAGAAMAQALEAAWPADAPLSGLVITRYGHIPDGWRPRRLEVVEAAHPVPDAAGLAASARLLAMTRGLTTDDLVICLISGGGSALLSLPAPGLTLADKQAVNRALLNSGAAIGEMNCVRKHLSAIKGGRLAAACAPARLLTIAISDVPGDEPAVIASGPTVADATTCADALAICRRYRIELPPAAVAGLGSGAFETPKPADFAQAGHEFVMLATPQMSLEAAAEAARVQGLAAYILSDEIEGESRVVGGLHAALARAVARRGQPFARPCVILSGGETTVTVDPARPAGKGGRATEFLLGCALALQGEPGVYALAADTDGIDGVGPHAGALLTPTSLGRARALGLNPQALLDGHDSASFFAPLGDLLVPGPTHTNVNDFRALLII